MLIKDIKKKVNGQVKKFNNKQVFYTRPDELRNYISDDDYYKICTWNGICIYSSPNGRENKCFYFYWGYGGNPDILYDIKIN